MKVTVTFGDTAVVVPCKTAWTVRDLTDQATRRYRRILEQHEESEVRTHHLTYIEGGIMDMDDLLIDLVEDRDKLVAVFDVRRGRAESPEETMSNGHSGTAPSPEPLHYFSHLQQQQQEQPMRGEIEVNEAVLKANTPLLVRSSSDPALAPTHETRATPPPENRAGGSPDPEIDHVLKGALDQLHTYDPPAKMSKVNYSTLTRAVEFPCDWGPLGIHVIPYCSSLSGRSLGLHIKGIEKNSRSAKENIFQQDECIVRINDTPLQDKTFAESQEVFRQAMSSPSSSVRLEVLHPDSRPRYEKSLIGQLFGADGKEPATAKARSPVGARAKTEAEPKQEVQRPEVQRPEVQRPEVQRPEVQRPELQRPELQRPELQRPDARAGTPETTTVPSVELRPRRGSAERLSPAPLASPPTPRAQSQTPSAGKSLGPSLTNLTNRKGSKKMKIELKKGGEGLGFTVVTRDSSVHGPGPILVKNILPRGAAVKDGRLQPGDRILEVNGVDMTGRSQEELVSMLRSTRQGQSVCVVVARQEDVFLPRELKGEEDGSLVMEDGREQLMYEVPLNESGSAGLGVSLKGNKSRETGEDLGIFIKSIIHGGAAYKDGRLSVNDQLIAVNGESLLGRSNHAAMETLRHSMSYEGNARGTIQLVVLRLSRQQMGDGSPAANAMAPKWPATHQPNNHKAPSNQDPRGHSAYRGPSAASRPPNAEPGGSGPNARGDPGAALYPAANTNDSRGHYGNADDEFEDGFPPPSSPGAEEKINEYSSQTLPRHSELQTRHREAAAAAFYADNTPRNRTSKSMDLVADESNMGSLDSQRNEPSGRGAMGPTLGLWKSSSLESLQTAVSAEQSRSKAQVPFHRPRPQVVRGRGCNQSFRIAIDKSYDGPSEDDDDLTDHSSGFETAASGSSRHGLDADDGKQQEQQQKKKTKGKKKEKKSKGGKKADDSVDEAEKKTKKKGFGLLRFGKKKDDKSKDAAKASRSKLEALSEEELDRGSYDPRRAEIHSGRVTPDSFPEVEDDDSDPNYARIGNFRQQPSPQSLISRTPSPAPPSLSGPDPRASADELDGLYAKVNKSRPPAALQNQHQTQADSDQRLQGMRRYQQARAAPVYDELDAQRRRVLEHDPHWMAPRGADSRPAPRYDEVDRQYPTQPRRDPYDYPTHSRPTAREPPYPDSNQRYHPPSSGAGLQHRAAVRQDVPPSPNPDRGGRPYYEAAGGRVDTHRQAGQGPERYERGDERQPDPRRKNPLIGAV
ncbi:par-3 family cell polarity regulator beta a isoform X3 [Gasterosteus aculeatus]